VCGHCGKAERDQWRRHWKRADHSGDPRELPIGTEPPAAWRPDWLKFLPPELLEMYDSEIVPEVPSMEAIPSLEIHDPSQL